MTFHLVATHQYGKGRSADLMRLAGSIAQQPGCRVDLHCLVQGVTALPAELVALQQPGRISFSTSEEFLSLSAARNRILAVGDLAPDDLLMFPDDDCYFPVGAFSFIRDMVEAADADLVFVPFADPPGFPASRDARLRRPTVFDVMRRVGSCNLVVKAKLARAVGAFDETLGLGATYPGGEDTDYAMRAWRLSRASFISSVSVVGHRSLSAGLRTRIHGMSRYWPGLFIVTVRYFEWKLAGLLVYRLAAGTFLLCTGKLPFRSVVGSLRAAFTHSPRRETAGTPISAPSLPLTGTQPECRASGTGLP
jgi:hypothetical protein